MKGCKVAILFSLLNITVSSVFAHTPLELTSPPENTVTQNALMLTLEPHQKLKDKFKSLTPALKEASIADIKEQWSTLATDEKQSLKQQAKMHLKNLKDKHLKEESNS